MQVGRQAQRALSMALAGECDDDVLRALYVESVVPAPDAAHLLVRLALPASWPGVQSDDIPVRLQRARGFLRRAVAEAVTRKRAPELTFILVPTGDAGGGA